MSSIEQVEYRRLGKSGLKVSVPIIGAMSFGSPEWADWVLGEEKALEIMKAAWDRGINTIDTANMYSNGESERIVGKFVQKYNIPRERIVIATKCNFVVAHTPGDRIIFKPEYKTQRDYINQFGLSLAAIFNAVEASLARLGTGYIDLLQIHRFDPDTPPEETMKALHDLVEAGKVRYLGASSMRCWQFAMLNEVAERNGWTRFVSMQNEYSLLYREEEREMIAYCKFNGIGIIPWAPLARGHLARPLNTETTRTAFMKGTPMENKITGADEQVINRVEEIAKKRGIKMSQVSLAWAASNVTSPIIGVSSVERLVDGITTGIVLTEEETKYLEEPYEPKAVRGHT